MMAKGWNVLHTNIRVLQALSCPPCLVFRYANKMVATALRPTGKLALH